MFANGTSRALVALHYYSRYRTITGLGRGWASIASYSIRANHIQSSLSSFQASTLRPFAIRAMLSIETLRSPRSTELR
jgi:hypothetical protein